MTDNDSEMTPAETEWALWAISHDVDTGGRCTCGHEGLGIDWHLSGCPGVEYALRRKVRELLHNPAEVAALRAVADARTAGLELLRDELDMIMDRLMVVGEPEHSFIDRGMADRRVIDFKNRCKEWGEERGRAQGVAYAIALMENAEGLSDG